MSTAAYLSLGSNLGDRVGYLAEAVHRLNGAGVRVAQVSSVYETVPQGKTDQPLFLNLAVKVETTLDPWSFLRHIQAVEQAMGRVRKERWGPRTLDIDIILFGVRVLSGADLEVPHPRMAERAFVLTPMLELHPGLKLPTTGAPLQDLLAALGDQGVRPCLAASSFLEHVRGVK